MWLLWWPVPATYTDCAKSSPTAQHLLHHSPKTQQNQRFRVSGELLLCKSSRIPLASGRTEGEYKCSHCQRGMVMNPCAAIKDFSPGAVGRGGPERRNAFTIWNAIWSNMVREVSALITLLWARAAGELFKMTWDCSSKKQLWRSSLRKKLCVMAVSPVLFHREKTRNNPLKQTEPSGTSACGTDVTWVPPPVRDQPPAPSPAPWGLRLWEQQVGRSCCWLETP